MNAPSSSTHNFTVVVPVYNREKTIGRCIDSILEQTHSHFELIVIDDGSTDETKKKVSAYRDSRIRYTHQVNKGVSAARNRGVSISRFNWITFIDSDDTCEPTWLQAFSAAISEFPNCGFVSCGFKELAADGTTKRVLLPEKKSNLFHQQKLNYLAGTFCVRKDILEAVGGYVEDLRFSENTELVLRIVQLCFSRGIPISNIENPLLNYIPSPTHEVVTSTPRLAERRLHAARYYLEHHRSALERDPRSLSDHYAIAAINAARLGHHDDARHYLFDAIKANPLALRNYLRLGRLILHTFNF